MKVTAIGDFKQSHIKFKTFHQKGIENLSQQMPSTDISAKLPFSPVAFGSSLSFINAGKTSFRNFVNIPCPCCGIKMLPMTSFYENFTERALSKPGKEVVKALSIFEGNMHPTEKKCFNLFEELSEQNPLKNLQELLITVKPEHLKKLIGKQIKILNEIGKMGAELSDKSAQLLIKRTNIARNKIIIPDEYNIFEIKPLISSLLNFKDIVPEKDVANKILEKANELPRARNDISAFVVKYSRRTPEEIGRRLLSSSVGTIEHIRPRTHKGLNMGKNYLLECAECNNTRSSIPFDKWLKMRPEMVKNLQTYMDEIIKQTNSGILRGYDWYPREVAATLEKESKGVVKLDISKAKQHIDYIDFRPLVEKYNKTT